MNLDAVEQNISELGGGGQVHDGRWLRRPDGRLAWGTQTHLSKQRWPSSIRSPSLAVRSAKENSNFTPLFWRSYGSLCRGGLDMLQLHGFIYLEGVQRRFELRCVDSAEEGCLAQRESLSGFIFSKQGSFIQNYKTSCIFKTIKQRQFINQMSRCYPSRGQCP